MDLSGITPNAVVANKLAATREEFSIQVMRRLLDVQTSQGMALVQMMAQTSGVGTNMDISA